ncbi:MAG: metallophosphoesterase [Clostridia bacterium]|nr:metallophosphoesterase [Clostridia bacterium]
MQILVVSDTHGDYRTLHKLIASKSNIGIVIFCGDGASDLNEVSRYFPEKTFIAVKGNNDWSCRFPMKEVRKIENHTFYITHGHLEHVKYGLGDLKAAARRQNADIVLFGHTHVPYTEYDNGMWIMNPGSLRRFDLSYGLIDIRGTQVLINTATF